MQLIIPAIERFIKTERSSLEEMVNALQQVGPLEGMDRRDYEWLAMNGTEYCIPAGELMFREGQPAEYLSILLAGEIQVRPAAGRGGVNLFVGRAGEITGLLPYSRMKAHGGDGMAVAPTWALAFHKAEFPRILENVPALQQRLVSVLLDRVREVTRMEQQAEKLNALNKLAGNLSHELNNPASAAQRSASHLLQELQIFGRQKFALGLLCLSQENLTALRAWEERVTRRDTPVVPGALVQVDLETDMQHWLDRNGIRGASDASVMLAESGLTVEDMDALQNEARLEHAALATYLAQFISSLRTRRMTEAVLHSTQRIFEIINAVKDYSYLDQAALQQVDLRQSLRSALAMLQSRLGGIEVVEIFADDLPRISAFGSELNLVWTALFENALDAMGKTGRLEIVVRYDTEWATVEITDNGSGIEPAIRSRIFEPFFTTKPLGKALGLGLDIAMRIVRKHRGVMNVTSDEDGTCFEVKLPFDQGRAY